MATGGTSSSSGEGFLSRMALNDNKAGMEGLNRDKINKIIMESSKGSRFYENELKKEQQVNQRIERMMLQKAHITEQQLSKAQAQVEKMTSDLERGRDLSRVIVHVDMDAFYAAVETRDCPDLMDKPMAVGSMSMLSTSNYHARKFGVRAAMPGFIAKKLCPNLVIVPTNFDKYRAVSAEVREVFADYDPHFLPMSLDEAYLDISDHLEQRRGWPEALRTHLILSMYVCVCVGIAPNMMLAKVCSDKNKPNGQYRLPSNRQAVIDFIQDLPVRKISGIGKVTEKMLGALGITSCSHLGQEMALLALLFSETSWHHFLHISMGLGSTHIERDGERKSMSTERTFGEMGALEEQFSLCKELCQDLAQDLQKEALKGKTVTLKLKNVNFEVKTRAWTLPCAVATTEELFAVAKDLLKTEIDNVSPQPLRLRLMGVRVSSFASADDKKPLQKSIVGFLHKKQTDSSSTSQISSHKPNTNTSAETDISMSALTASDKMTHEPSAHASTSSYCSTEPESGTDSLTCPVCFREVNTTELTVFNRHIDQCLSGVTMGKLLSRCVLDSVGLRLDSSAGDHTESTTGLLLYETSTANISLSTVGLNPVCLNTCPNGDVSIHRANTLKVSSQSDPHVRVCLLSPGGPRPMTTPKPESRDHRGPALTCPVCQETQDTNDLTLFNRHVDLCLNQEVLHELGGLASVDRTTHTAPPAAHKGPCFRYVLFTE
uniref:DNA polymerase kappa n=1 Tax=Oncorhynchus tshawytscha TaxID=74940 RepID=A0A8C8D1Z5_ONCTS